MTFLCVHFCLIVCLGKWVGGVIWTLPGSAQDSFLALHTGISPDDAWRTIWDTSNCTRVGHMPGKCTTHSTMTLAPSLITFN